MPTIDEYRIIEHAEAIIALAKRPPTPEPPEPPDPNGRVVDVVNPGDLPRLITAAQESTTFLLTPGTVYPPISLPVKPANVKIAIRPSREMGPGCVVIDQRPWPLPEINQIHNDTEALPAIDMEPRSHDLSVRGVKMNASPWSQLGVVRCGRPDDDTSVDDQPTGLTLDQVWIQADPALGSRRAVAANGRSIAVLNSRIKDFWAQGNDSQAISCWTGAGPFRIENNELTASGECVLFGGGRPLPGVQPSGLTFLLNYCWMPKAWAPIAQCKNLFELKNMRGAVVEYNVFENSFVDAQSGHAMLLTSREGPIDDVEVRYNVIRHVEGFWLQLLGNNDEVTQEPFPPQSRNLTVHNNLITATHSGILLTNGWDQLAIHHNTIQALSGNLLSLNTRLVNGQIRPEDLVKGLSMVDNIFPGGDYGIHGAHDTASGVASLNRFAAPGWQVQSNVFEDSTIGQELNFPPGNQLVKAGTIYTSLDAQYMPIPPAWQGKGADVPKIRAMLPWAF